MEKLQEINTTKCVVLFDGVCNLCNRMVQVLLDLDKHNKLYFSSLQSDYGQNILANFDLPLDDFHSFIFLKHGKIYQKSDGVLEVCRELGGIYRAFYFFKIVPVFLRNGVYRLIAQNRYRWFGKKEKCRIPTPELKARFLE